MISVKLLAAEYGAPTHACIDASADRERTFAARLSGLRISTRSTPNNSAAQSMWLTFRKPPRDMVNKVIG
jgi:hypothetical protein